MHGTTPRTYSQALLAEASPAHWLHAGAPGLSACIDSKQSHCVALLALLELAIWIRLALNARLSSASVLPVLGVQMYTITPSFSSVFSFPFLTFYFYFFNI